jgi:3-phenylpropionate/trans-cinnamate dioxygenase ferredoxin reductase subunit
MTSTPSPPAGLVVVGGGPAGHSAAVAYRQAGGDAPVLILSADDAPPYERPPLSKEFLRGEAGSQGLPLAAPQFYRDNDIELRLDDPVAALDRVRGVVRTRSGHTAAYANCVLATGSEPIALPVPGGDHPGVLALRSLSQARLLRSRTARAASAIVIGSGFIGCEAAASLARRGLQVTMLSTEELPQVQRLGRRAAERIAGWLTEAGVRFVGGAEVASVDGGSSVRTADGASFAADLILSAVGVRPRGELAERAGLAMQDRRILVDGRMTTSDPRVYAAGDIALASNGAAGRRLAVEHWGEALRMGEIAGTNAAGGDDSWSDVPGFWSEIGTRTLKYAAWGDGYDRAEIVDHRTPGVPNAGADGENGFTVWYSQLGTVVGVLTCDADDDYERGSELIAAGAAAPAAARR